jgi:hypothetical protein
MSNNETKKQDQASENLLKAVLEQDMKEQLKFTPQIKLTHKMPEVDMLARIEFNCPDMGLMVVDFTFKFESDTEYCGLDKDGYCMSVKKEGEFIAWHTVDDRSELDIAKEDQLKSFSKKLNIRHQDKKRYKMLVKMQEQNMLAEIILPLEK